MIWPADPEITEQVAGADNLGVIQYRDSTALGYSAFANFLDDFSGPSGSATRTFGVKPFHPNQFRQSYFFQDNWKATPALALTFGLRYENFGQFINAVPYPAFAGFDPALFLVRNEVNRDDNNFGPAFGFAWSPTLRSGWLGKLLGDGKTVWRGGYQISYDAMFTQINLARFGVNDAKCDQYGIYGPEHRTRITQHFIAAANHSKRPQFAGSPAGRGGEGSAQSLYRALVLWLPASTAGWDSLRRVLRRDCQPQADHSSRFEPAAAQRRPPSSRVCA